MLTSSPESIGGSFRDPHNLVYLNQDAVFRKILPAGFDDYQLLMTSGLYHALVEQGLLVSHTEVFSHSDAIILKPDMIPFISYPYEWCFSQYQDAALLTLTIQKIAMNYGMSLKDASAYNVQFLQGKPIFIDTMSFEKMKPNKPWIAYNQYCRHFLAPLALMSYNDLRLQQLMMSNIDGIPLDLAANLLPFKSRFSLGLYLHIHLHAKFQKKHGAKGDSSVKNVEFSRHKLNALIDSLESSTRRLKLNNIKTEWAEYYSVTNYTDSSFEHKNKIIVSFLEMIKPNRLIDLGGNDGRMARLASKLGVFCISADIDPIAVEKCYYAIKKNNDTSMLPLLLDLNNPSPNIGWHNQERDCFSLRAKADCMMALALIHHLVIANNIPIEMVAKFFAELAENLIIEFVPKSDSMVVNMLSSREDIFTHYNQTCFEEIFLRYFKIEKKENIPGSERSLYWMKKII